MSRILLLNDSERIGTLIIESNKGFFCAVIEVHEKDHQSSWQRGSLENLLRVVFTTISQNTEDKKLPVKMAQVIHSTLLNSNNAFGLFTVMYLGFSVTGDEVNPCLAGGSRLHLLQGDKLISVTT